MIYVTFFDDFLLEFSFACDLELCFLKQSFLFLYAYPVNEKAIIVSRRPVVTMPTIAVIEIGSEIYKNPKKRILYVTYIFNENVQKTISANVISKYKKLTMSRTPNLVFPLPFSIET